MHRPAHFALYALPLVAALLAGCVVAPHQPQPAPAVVYPSPPPPNYAYEQIRRCQSDNQQAHAEALDAYERARRAGRIDPREAQNFNAMEARLRNLRIELGRDGISLQDCQRIAGAIARERSEIARMSRSDPALARCVADNQRAHQDVVGLYENARRSGRINPNEAQRFKAMEARLQNLRTDLARDGISLQDCQRISGTIAKERAAVEQMVR